MSILQVRVDGVWLRTVAPWTDLELRYGRNGPTGASWSMALRRGQRPPILRRNADVEVYDGPSLVWAGRLTDPDWDAGTFGAVGIARLGEGAECLTAGSAVTSVPNTALDQAIVRGVVPWTRVGSFGATALAGATGSAGVDDPAPGKLNELLGLWAVGEETQWKVEPDGRVMESVEDESTPDWLILPGAGELGVASDEVTDRVFLSYIDSTAGVRRNVSYPAATPAGGVERRGSVEHHGKITAARANVIAAALYRRAQEGRSGWSNGIQVTRGQVLTLGGQIANIGQIRPGHTICLLDHPDPRSAARSTNVVVGDTIWRPDEQSIQLNPVGLAARTWEQVMESLYTRSAE